MNISVSFSASMLERFRLQLTIQAMQTHLYLARLRALSESTDLTICPRNATLQCGSDWSQPWLLMQNHEVLFQFAPFPQLVKIDYQGLQQGPLVLAAEEESNRLAGHFYLSTPHWQKKLIQTVRGDLRESS